MGLPLQVYGSLVELGNSVSERLTLNRGSLCSNRFAALSKLGHFCSIHDSPVHSGVSAAVKMCEQIVFMQLL